MKVQIDTKKIADVGSNVFNKAADVSKLAVAGMHESAKNISDKAKNDSYIRKVKKYNPVFPDTFDSKEFNIPNVIMIVDDAERRGIDVCDGAIGWLRNEAGLEIFCLYDEAINTIGLKFLPNASCNSIYCVDSFDRSIFVKADYIFERAYQEKIAELKNIAYCLGATKCYIEIKESSSETNSTKKKSTIEQIIPIKGLSSKEDIDVESKHKESSTQVGRAIAEFEGSDKPTVPALKWFANSDAINNLIRMRCDGTHKYKKDSLELYGAASSTMSQKMACAIDAAMGKIAKIKGKGQMEALASKENKSTFIFEIEF